MPSTPCKKKKQNINQHTNCTENIVDRNTSTNVRITRQLLHDTRSRACSCTSRSLPFFLHTFSLSFLLHDMKTTQSYTLSLHDALPISKIHMAELGRIGGFQF